MVAGQQFYIQLFTGERIEPVQLCPMTQAYRVKFLVVSKRTDDMDIFIKMAVCPLYIETQISLLLTWAAHLHLETQMLKCSDQFNMN